jgi:hypothetical protein
VVSSNVAIARELVDSSTEGTPEPPELDAAYAAWFTDWRARPAGERDDPNVFDNAFGLAFGQHLVDTLGLEWAIVTDEHGTEIAVHGQPGDVLVFPPNLVAKRLERGEMHFFEPLSREIGAQVRALGRG